MPNWQCEICGRHRNYCECAKKCEPYRPNKLSHKACLKVCHEIMDKCKKK